jgi:hypothetical protein
LDGVEPGALLANALEAEAAAKARPITTATVVTGFIVSSVRWGVEDRRPTRSVNWITEAASRAVTPVTPAAD